ncbi:MAG: hypothetical protein U0840_02615 [Gemmataceae bacterium]
MQARQVVGIAANWLGRGAALVLLLFWGAFFVEHLSEWFLRDDGAYPPVWVWAAQGLHLAMLIGLGVTILRPWLGMVLTLVGTVAFFGWIGVKSFPYLALINLVPLVLLAVSWLASGGSNEECKE